VHDQPDVPVGEDGKTDLKVTPGGSESNRTAVGALMDPGNEDALLTRNLTNIVPPIGASRDPSSSSLIVSSTDSSSSGPSPPFGTDDGVVVDDGSVEDAATVPASGSAISAVTTSRPTTVWIFLRRIAITMHILSVHIH